jgi:hypothetical protein
MILINTKTGQSFSNVSKTEVARKIGVCSKTVGNWQKSKTLEYFNHWIVGLHEIKLKQMKGFKIRVYTT